MPKITNTLLTITNKYNYVNILRALNSSNVRLQVTNNVMNDSVMQNSIKHNIAVDLENFRDACIDLQDQNNQQKVLDYFNYLCGQDPRNAEYRGLQFHLASEIYRDITTVVNTDFTTLHGKFSASALGCSQKLNMHLIPYTPRVGLQNSFFTANSDSFKHGIETVYANVDSGVTGAYNQVTGDFPIVLPQTNKPIIVDHLQRNNDINSHFPSMIVQKDLKMMCVSKVSAMGLNGNLISVGATDTKPVIITLAQIALRTHAYAKMQHVETSKNNTFDKQEILAKLVSSGDIREAAGLTGFPKVVSNEFFQP